MSLRYVTKYGSIDTAYAYRGIDEGEVWLDNLDDLTPEQAKAMLPAIVRDLDRRLLRLEEQS